MILPSILIGRIRIPSEFIFAHFAGKDQVIINRWHPRFDLDYILLEKPLTVFIRAQYMEPIYLACVLLKKLVNPGNKAQTAGRVSIDQFVRNRDGEPIASATQPCKVRPQTSVPRTA